MVDVISSDDHYTSPNGVTFRLKKVSRLLLLDAIRKVPEPKVPVMYDEDKDREEENPHDPDYLKAMQDFNFEQGMASLSVALAFGTVIEGDLPDDVPQVDSDEWIEVVQSLGIEINTKNRALRYVAWLKYIVLGGDEAITGLLSVVMRYSGLTTEEDVAAAEKSFRSDTSGDTVDGVGVTAGSESRNNGRVHQRLSAGARGA